MSTLVHFLFRECFAFFQYNIKLNHIRLNKTMPDTAKEKPSKRTTTREALMYTALKLVGEGKVYSNLSLREVTKATGVVPAAFYRHFKGMDVMGHELVEQSFAVLRDVLNNILSRESIAEQNTTEFIHAFVENLSDNISHLRFVISEYFGGTSKLRMSVRKEFQILRSDVAMSISLLYPEKDLSRDDLHMLAELCVQMAMTMAKQILDHYESNEYTASQEEANQLVSVLGKQLQIVLIGVHNWDNKR